MKTLMRSIVIQMLCGLISFAPLAHADLSVQGLFAVRNERMADVIQREYLKLDTVPQFIERFADDRSPKERAELIKKFSALKQLPRMERTETGFSFPDEGFPITIDTTKGANGHFVINGVVITIDPKLPLLMQTEIVMRKLQENGKSPGKKFSLLSLLVPEAQAGATAAILKGAAKEAAKDAAKTPGLAAELGKFAKIGIAMAIANKVVDRYGNWVLDMTEKAVCMASVDRQNIKDPDLIPQDPNWCIDYWAKKKELLLKKAELAKANPETEAGKAFSKSTQDGWKYGTYPGDKCPKKGTPSEYSGTIKLVYDPKADAKIKSNPIVDKNKKLKEEIYIVDVKAVYDGSKVTGMKVIRDDAAVPTLFLVDNQPVFTAFIMPALPDGVGKQYLMADSNNSLQVPAAGSISDPKLAKEQTINQKIYAFVQSNIQTCINNANNQAVISEPNPEKEKASKAAK